MVLLAEGARAIDEVVEHCLDRLQQFYTELHQESNKSGRILEKCSLWTQGHLEYTTNQFLGTVGQLEQDHPAWKIARELEEVLEVLTDQTNQLLGVGVWTLAEPLHTAPTTVECQTRLNQAAELAVGANAKISGLRERWKKSRPKIDDEVNSFAARWTSPPAGQQ